MTSGLILGSCSCLLSYSTALLFGITGKGVDTIDCCDFFAGL